jgi:N-acyl homoserine lactone hydrolase
VKVHAIETGTVTVRARQRRGVGSGAMRTLRTMADREWTERLPIHAWLIEHPEGLILVDTGESARSSEPGWFPRWHPYFRLAVRLWVAPEEEIGPQVERLGFSPADVRKVVLTHLHTDHAGGLGHFPNSEILIHRRELRLAGGFPGKVRGCLPHRLPDWLSPRPFAFDGPAVGPFDSSVPVTEAGDVLIVPTPGHTPGHVSVVLEESDHALFFAGDASYTQDLMLEGAVDGVAPDDAVARETLGRIQEFTRRRPTVYLPAHDPGSAARLEGRTVVPTIS